jgi:DNA modification methylase
LAARTLLVRRQKLGSWRGDRKQTTIWDIENLNPMGGNKNEKPTGHGTQKPVECMRRPILNHTDPGQSLYDPFMGSGTTIIAAESTERVAFGVEIDPAYVDVCVKRWEEFTGKRAVLESTGKASGETEAAPKAKPKIRGRKK